MTSPASIRYNNPGAQYPGPSARTYGSTGTEIIGGGHQIAVFPDPVSGAAAQFDLLQRGYSNKSLRDALHKWSGGNNADSYLAHIVRKTGLPAETVISPEFLRSPQGVALVRSMAEHEAGQPYPMTDQQWAEAQSRVFGGVPPTQVTSADPAVVASSTVAPQPSPPAPTQPATPNPLMELANSLSPPEEAKESPAPRGPALPPQMDLPSLRKTLNPDAFRRAVAARVSQLGSRIT
jgi:hypothetical protein